MPWQVFLSSENSYSCSFGSPSCLASSHLQQTLRLVEHLCKSRSVTIFFTIIAALKLSAQHAVKQEEDTYIFLEYRNISVMPTYNVRNASKASTSVPGTAAACHISAFSTAPLCRGGSLLHSTVWFKSLRKHKFQWNPIGLSYVYNFWCVWNVSVWTPAWG